MILSPTYSSSITLRVRCLLHSRIVNSSRLTIMGVWLPSFNQLDLYTTIVNYNNNCVKLF